MIAPFVSRRPWAATVVSLILGPAFGMLYLGKGRKGLAYLLVEFLAVVLPVVTAHLEFSSLGIDLERGLWVIAVRAVGVLHCFFVAKGLHARRPSAWFARWYSLVGLLIVAPMFVAIVVRSFVLEPFNMATGSMLPNLEPGDHFFVSKSAYGYSRYSLPLGPPVFSGRIFFRAPERGDIVVFKLPKDTRTDYIKRIVGLPGDTIQVSGGVLHINGESVKRRKLRELEWTSDAGFIQRVSEYTETLPNGSEYRIWEFSDQDMLDNTPVYEVPPGHYFMIGDNRDSSQDSRVMSQVGFVPGENLIGKLTFFFWSDRERKLTFLGHE